VVVTLVAGLIAALATGLKDAAVRRYRRWRRRRAVAGTNTSVQESFFVVQNTATGFNSWMWYHEEIRQGRPLGAGILKLAATNTGEHDVEISHVEIHDLEPVVIVETPIIGVRNRRTNRESARQPIEPATTADVRIEFHFLAPLGRIRKRPRLPVDRGGRLHPRVVIRTNFGRNYEVDCSLVFMPPPPRVAQEKTVNAVQKSGTA